MEKQRNRAWAISALLAAAALLLGMILTAQLVRSDFYASRVEDGAGLLSENSYAMLTAQNRTLDAMHECVCGVVTTQEQPIADFAEQTFIASRYGENDLLLVLNPEGEQWYLTFGDRFAQYMTNDLRTLVADAVAQGLFDAPEAKLPALHHEICVWVTEHLPVHPQLSREMPISGAAFLRCAAVILLPLAAAAGIAYFVIFPLCGYDLRKNAHN